MESRGEKIIRHILDSLKIEFKKGYELHTLYHDDEKTFRIPDFWIPKHRVVIEYEGLYEKDEQEKSRYDKKALVYFKNGIRCLHLYNHHIDVWDEEDLKRLIKSFIKDAINEDEVKELRKSNHELKTKTNLKIEKKQKEVNKYKKKINFLESDSKLLKLKDAHKNEMSKLSSKFQTAIDYKRNPLLPISVTLCLLLLLTVGCLNNQNSNLMENLKNNTNSTDGYLQTLAFQTNKINSLESQLGQCENVDNENSRMQKELDNKNQQCEEKMENLRRSLKPVEDQSIQKQFQHYLLEVEPYYQKIEERHSMSEKEKQNGFNCGKERLANIELGLYVCNHRLNPLCRNLTRLFENHTDLDLDSIEKFNKNCKYNRCEELRNNFDSFEDGTC